MVTVFDGFDKLSDDEIRGQIAILRHVTFTNSLKERSQKAVRFLVEAASGIFSTGKESGEEDAAQITNVRKITSDCFEELKGCNRKELDTMLKQELIKKNNAVSTTVLTENSSNDEIHFTIVKEAARVYMIDENKTPQAKADEICEKYYQQYVTVLQRKLEKMGRNELDIIAQRIQREIVRSDIVKMRHLANEMFLTEFNGKTIVSSLMHGNINKLQRVIDVFGLGIFDGLDCVISTAFDSVMMFCRMERAILAQCVWTAGNGYNRKFRLSDDLMPSFKSGMYDVDDEKERKLLILISRENQLNKVLKELLSDIDKKNKQLVIREERLEKEKEKLAFLNDESVVLEEEKNKITADGEKTKKAYEDYIAANPVKNNSDIQFRQIKQDYENLARNVRSADSKIQTNARSISKTTESIAEWEKKIADIKNETYTLREKLVEHVREFNEVIFLQDNEAGYLSQVLKRRWEKFFTGLSFENRVYDQTVRQFTHKEIVAIEHMLYELEQCDNKELFNLRTGSSDGDDLPMYCYCVVGTGKNAKISYKDSDIFSIEVKERI
ncbi:MAG: hypothetical protein ACI4GD_03910 [Lachnospiraceae bacterium]